MLWRKTEFLRSGIGLMIVVFVLVGLRLLWIHLQRPAHLEEVAAAFGSASLFHDAPQLSHSGDQFTFVKTSAHGYALYLCNADTGQKQILFELNNYLGKHGTEFELQSLPWSPDDSSFLCVVSNQLMIYSLDTNQEQVAIEDKPVSAAVWLNPTEFAYLIDGTNLCIAQKQENGKWGRYDLLSCNSRMSSLTAISEDTIAWLENNAICRLTLSDELADTQSSTGVPPTNNTQLGRMKIDSAETVEKMELGSGGKVPRSTSVRMPDATNAPPSDGLVLWLDASKLHQLDRSPVTRLKDLSGNRNDAFWNGHPPIFNGTNGSLALQGKGTIHFSSFGSVTNASGLRTRAAPGIAGSAPRSVFVVMRHDAHGDMMVNMGDARTKGSLFALEITNYLYLPTGWRGADNRIRFASTNWNVLETIYDGATQRGYVNGILRGVAKAKLNTAVKPLEIGLRTADPAGKNAKGSDGDFAELLVYNRALNLTEREQVEDYLRSKWFGAKPKNLPSQNPYVWFIPEVEGLTSFSYSKETGQFLLNCEEGRYGFLWQYDPQTAGLTKIVDGALVQDEQWFGDGESAYYVRDSKHSGIILRDPFGVEEDRVLPGANILWFQASPDNDKLLILGAISNQPSAALWQYDIALRRLKPLVPYSDKPSIYTKGVTPTNVIIKSPSGEKLVCTIYPPVNFNPHKKYPLVIGNTVFTDPIYRYQGPCWAPAIANCGGYVVIVERKSWGHGLDKWGTDVMIAYNSLKGDLNIDTTQVYLFGSSAETSYMSSVLTDSLGLWKGVILLNPSGLPDLSKTAMFQQRPRILVSAGAEEHENARFINFQYDLLKSGVMDENIIHPGEGHHIVGNAAELARTKAILYFIFEK